MACIGLLTAVSAFAQVGGFGGPSVLSRGTRPMGREGAPPVSLRGSVTVSGIYGSGLTPPATDDRGGLLDEGTPGGQVSWTLTGNRNGRRDAFFISYGGSYQAYTEATYFSGLNQGINLTYSRQLSRRWTTFLSQGGMSSNSIFGGTRLVATDELSAELPSTYTEIVDNRFLLLSSAAGASYQKSARLAFNFSGGFVAQRRRSTALSSSNGILGNAGMSYMVSRRQQIGVSYSYGSYYLTRGFGDSKIQNAMFTVGRALSRRWFLNGGVGAFRSDTVRLQQVAVDPFIVLLTGQTTTLEIFEGKRYGLAARAGLSGRFRRSSLDFRYQRGVNPGNGIYFIAETETIGASFGYDATSRWSLSGSFDVNRMKGITQTVGSARGNGAYFNTSYRLNSIMHLTAGAQVFGWNIRSTSYARTRFQASAGITFSPGELPLSLW